ncbi:hypothetical protein [Streptomyces sp. CoH17]|uniref:hypothetical protein n=1 Tax=Streptomyces sp. CoH17 TaxID=2992806 RepID=UPI00227177D4|nr:hypothetical protein [Streptomyces sp. CoH17]
MVMKPGNTLEIPPDPQGLTWSDRAQLLSDRAAAVDFLVRRSVALRDMLWTGLATAVIAGACLMTSAAVGWYRGLGDPQGADLVVAVAVGLVLLPAAGAAAVAFVRVVRRGRAAQKLLEAWTALDRQPSARSLPAGDIPQPLASTWDLMRSGRPWKETVPLDGRRYLLFLAGTSLAWVVVPVAPVMIGAVVVLAAPAGDFSDGNGPYVQLGVVGAGGVLVVAGLWAIGKGVRHYMWALREARARVSEEKAWPVTPARW